MGLYKSKTQPETTLAPEPVKPPVKKRKANRKEVQFTQVVVSEPQALTHEQRLFDQMFPGRLSNKQ